MSDKIQNSVGKIKKIYGEAFSLYPVTIVCELIATLMLCIYSCMVADIYHADEYGYGPQIFIWMMLFMIFFTAGSFAVEALPKKWYEKSKNIKKISTLSAVAIIAGALVSMILGYVLTIEIKQPNQAVMGVIAMCEVAYFVLCILIVIYSRYKDSHTAPEKYFVSVSVGIIQLAAVWGILFVGFYILSIFFCELIVDDNSIEIIPQLLVIGLYVVPCFVMTFSKVKEEIGKLFEALIKYVMMAISLTGAVIIYIYIIKTIFLDGIPSNSIFSITSMLFLVAIPVGFACTAFDKDSFLQKVAYVMPYIYAPFIILQAYSIIVRIVEYGMTISRYMGVVMVVLEIIYTVVYALAKKHIDKIVPVMMGLTLIVAVIPGINASDVSRISHERIINRFLEEGMPATSEEQKRVCGAYRYLLDYCGEEYVDSILTREQQETISVMGTMAGEYVFRDFSSRYYLTSDNSFLPVDGFEYIAGFDVYPPNMLGEVNTSAVTIIVDDIDLVTYDFTEEINSLISRCKEKGEDTIHGEDIIHVSDDCELIITYLYIACDEGKNACSEMRVSGHILFNEEFFGSDPSTAVTVN